MTLGERIRKVRKTLDLTQREFGERIKLKSNSIALIEGGRNTSDQTVLAICQAFNVSEEWLRTGEGKMFVPTPKSELEALAAKYPNMTHETFIFIEKLVELSTEKQNIIMGFLKDVTSKFKDTASVPTSEEEARAEAERYYQQLLLEKKQESQASSASESDAG